MQCMYCGKKTINYSMFAVRKAVKPKHYPNRWKEIGYCCDECEAEGGPIQIEYSDEVIKRFDDETRQAVILV